MHQPILRPALGLLLTLGLWLAAPAGLHSQEPYRISGSVQDANNGRPLAGVQVALRATGLGTLSDAGGEFGFTAAVEPGVYTLRFTQLGRASVSREVTLGRDQAVAVGAIALEQSAVELEEVVVTGTGVEAERRAVANTVESIAGEEVADAPGAVTIDQALQGKVTGALISENSGQPGGGVSIRLRGTSSILGGAEPLIVVDGVIIDNSDAALVSLGANAGRGSAALTNRLSDIPLGDVARIEILKGAAAAALYGSRANNGVIQIFTKRGQQGEPRVTFRTELSINQTPDQYDLLLDVPFAGLGDVVFAGADSIGAPVERGDIQDEIFQTSAGTTNYLSVSGGTGGTNYFVSGLYAYDEGILRSTDYEKKSAKASISQNITDNLRLNAVGNFIQTKSNFIVEGEQTQGTLTNAIFSPTSFDFSFDPELGRYPYTLLGANPLDVFENWEFPESVVRFLGSVTAEWSPISNLTFRNLLAIDDYRQESRYFQPPGSVNASDPGRVANPLRLSRQWNNDLTANHSWVVTPTTELNTAFGVRYTSDRSEVITATATDLPPGQKTVGGANQFTGQSIVEIRTLGGFVQERLSFSDRLFITGGLNLEGASAFGADERYQLFPRVGVSWVVHEEPFWPAGGPGGVFSTLRLRAAYGQTGGQPPSAYSQFNSYVDVAFGGKPGLVPSSLAGNPDLKPERQREYEGGFEAGFFDDKAQLSFTYYDQLTTDLVLPVPLPLSSGFSSQFQNIGEITNRGVEVSLNTLNLQTPGFSWSSRLSYAANRNRVEKLVTTADTLVFGYLNAVIEGQPIGVFYGRGYQRDAQGDIVIDPNTGLGARGSDFVVLGDPNPDFTLSLGNQLAFGDNFTLDVLLDGRFGNQVANFTRRITEFFGSDAVVGDEIERAIARKSNPDLQPIKYTLNAGRISNYEEYVEDGGFVKLREIALNYTLPREWVNRLGFRGVDLRLAGRNLYTWTDYSGLDPEINLFAGNTVARGVDFAVTPVPRVFALGATFHF